MRLETLLEYAPPKRNLSGYNTREPLYHGSFWEFDAFNGKSLTSKYLYTTPTKSFASVYGRVVYTCYGRPGRQVDLRTDRDMQVKLSRKLAHYFRSDAERELRDLERNMAKRMAKKARSRNYEDFLYAASKTPEFKKALDEKAFELAMRTHKTGSYYRSTDDYSEAVLAACFAAGYDSVRKYEAGSGKPDVAVIFKDFRDVMIVKKEVKR